MIRMRCPDSGAATFTLLWEGRRTTSDMSGLPYQGKFEMEGGSAADLAFHLDLAGMFLNNAVTHCQSKPCAPALAFAYGRFGGEERIVNALHVFECDARAGIGDVNRDQTVCLGGYTECAAGCHGVLSVEKQIKKDL